MVLLALQLATATAAEREEFCIVTAADYPLKNGTLVVVDCGPVVTDVTRRRYETAAEALNYLSWHGWTLVTAYGGSAVKPPSFPVPDQRTDPLIGSHTFVFRRMSEAALGSSSGASVSTSSASAEALVLRAYVALGREKGAGFATDTQAVKTLLDRGKSERDVLELVAACRGELTDEQPLSACFE